MHKERVPALSVPYATFPLQHYCLSVKRHLAIGVLQNSPSLLAFLSDEGLASALQMILGLLRKMTQERGNMGLQ